MKILICGGDERSVLLAGMLKDDGHEVLCFCMDKAQLPDGVRAKSGPHRTWGGTLNAAGQNISRHGAGRTASAPALSPAAQRDCLSRKPWIMAAGAERRPFNGSAPTPFH